MSDSDWDEKSPSPPSKPRPPANAYTNSSSSSEIPFRAARGRGRPGTTSYNNNSGNAVGSWRNDAVKPPLPREAGGRGGGGWSGGSADGGVGGGGAASDGATTTETVEVENRFVGRLIGTKGATRKDLEERSGGRINIVQKDRSDPTANVEISGTREAIDKAKDAIAELTGGDGGGGGGRECFKCGEKGMF